MYTALRVANYVDYRLVGLVVRQYVAAASVTSVCAACSRIDDRTIIVLAAVS